MACTRGVQAPGEARLRCSMPLVLIAALVLVACQAGVAPTPGSQPEAEARLKQRGAVALRGTVLAPAGLVGADGGSLIGADGASLIGLDGATLVAAGAGYALRAAGEVPLADATVFLAYADGTPVTPAVVAKTDARGRFTFASAPAGRYLVVALATTPGQTPVRLSTLTTAITAETTADLSLATTLVAQAALNRREGEIVGYDTATYGQAVSLAARALAEGGAPDLGDRDAVAAAVDRLVAAPGLAPLITRLRAEVVGTPRPRSTRPPATAEPAPLALPAAAPLAPDPVAPDPGAATPDPLAVVPVTPPTDAPAPVATPAPVIEPPAPPDYVGNVDVDTLSGGEAGFADGGDDARYNRPSGLGVGAFGTIYVGDTDNHTVRTLEPALGLWLLSSPWGQGPGFSTAPARGAKFNAPRGIAVVPGAGRYVADSGNHLIRYLPLKGDVVAWAGSPALGPGFVDGPREQARFSSPLDVWWSPTLGLFVADAGNHRIRRVSDDGVSTHAGSTAGYADGLMDAARFNRPSGVVGAPNGAIYVADTDNHRIRRIFAGQVTTVAGDGKPGFSDGPAAGARVNLPTSVAVALDGSLLVADRGNRRIRLIGTDGRVRTLAGTGGPVANDGPGNQAAFAAPVAVAVQPITGNAYVADGHRIRRIKF